MAASYTNFPHLFDTIETRSAPVSLQFQWPLAVPSELIVFSWADLLYAYTAVSKPVFTLQEKATQVDLRRRSCAQVEVNGGRARDGPHTSLTIDNATRPAGDSSVGDAVQLSSSVKPSCALELRYRPGSGNGCLASAGHVPQSFLPQILAQLQQSMTKGATVNDLGFLNNITLSVANPHRKVLPGPELLHRLISEPASTAIAIDFLSADKRLTRLSYQDLDRLSNRLADRLGAAISRRYRDSSTEKVVPILMEQNPHLYVAQIATLKCGACFCPLNLDVPPNRLALIAKDVGARVVLTTAAFRQRFAAPGLNLDILLAEVDQDEEAQATRSCFTRAVPSPSAESLAYIMYTSGSTGLPKGVGVSHRAVTQALLAHDEHVPKYHRFLQFAAPTFDVSVFEIFFTFYRGATLASCYREDMVGDLTGMMRALSVDAAELTPTVALTLLRNWDEAPSLRLLLTIGETLSNSVIQSFGRSSKTGRILLPVYGPTEASIHCTIKPETKANASAATIGRPLSTVSAFAIAEDQSIDPRVLPLGHVGELAIAGQLAQGYINRPKQTDAAFVRLAGHGLVYRTGDRVRMLPSGEFSYLGRIAEGQVKIRGQRVELGEIEQVVSRTTSIRFALARIIDGNVVVFCMSEQGPSASASQAAVKEQCKAWLPSFMQPAEVVPLDGDLPRLPSGKIDKRALEARYLSGRGQARSDTCEATDELEYLISSTLRNELGIIVDRGEGLRSRGLDSLRAIRLASVLSTHHVEISAIDIISADTIAGLCKNLKQRGSSKIAAPRPIYGSSDELQALSDSILSEIDSPRRADVEEILPCSQMQCAMLSESALSKHISFNRITIRAVRSVAPSKFVEAFCHLARLNSILRSGFLHTQNPIFPYVRVVWKDLDTFKQIQWIHAGSAGKPPHQIVDDFTLLRPLRLEITRHPESTIITVYIHHALYDGWSWDLIIADLESLVADKEPATRPQFQQFVHFENVFLAAQDTTPAHEYWTHQLRNVNPMSLPILTRKKHKHEFHVSQKAIQTEIGVLSQQLRISRHSIPSAAFGTILHLYYGSPDVVYGSVSSGRTLPIPGIENIIGPCISTLPVRINFDRLHTVRDLILHAHHLHYDFLHFGQVPLRDLKKIAGISSDQALFDALFVWQERLESDGKADSALSTVDETDSIRYSLVLEVEPMCHELHLKCTYDQSIMCSDQVEIFMNQFEAILEFYSRSPDAPWKEALDCFPPEDLSIANADFTSLNPLPPISSTVDRLAEADPTRVAIEFVEDLDPLRATMKSAKISYSELSEKSTTISQYLLSNGIMADQLVCVFMDKSVPLYISILGALKAGAGYVVVDPQGPPERMYRILDATNCRYCLTRSHFDGHSVLNRIANVIFYDRIQAVSLPERPISTTPGTHLAYSVFTSGSTGVPKGVLVSRRNILSNIDVLSRIYPSVEDGALLQACSPAFDVSVFEILFTWHMGMRLCAASNDILFRDLESFIRLLNITHLSLTPTVAAIVEPDNVPKVQALVTAGEALTAKVFTTWSGRGLNQGYGPSETTNICSVHSDVSHFDHQNNIGQPLPNTSMFIFNDETYRPLPKGALGKIWIGGDQVGRGYLNDAETTAENFVHHPQYGRLYRSGDLGRMLPNGETLFHGREDDQVKLRGQRIQLGAIEHALVQMSAVLDSVCLLVEEGELRTRCLAAFWCSTPSSHAEPIAYVKPIFDELMSQLPSYMVPDYLIHIDALPYTSNGKTDRKSLQQLFLRTDPVTLKSFSRECDGSGDADIKDQKELKIAEALAEITCQPLSMIHRNTSFYALGLDSMTSINLARKLCSLGFGQVDVSTVLRQPSIAKLIPTLSSAPQSMNSGLRGSSSLQHIFDEPWLDEVKSNFARKGFNVEKVLPSTPLQEAMIFHVEGDSTGTYYNQLTFSVVGDLTRLHHAWEICVAAHEILRTAFAVTDSPEFPYAQVVLSHYEPSWSCKDDMIVTGVDEAEPFMMPPYCFVVAEQSEMQPIKLVLKIHHALYDAQAISLLLRDVEQSYRTSALQKATSLEPYLEYMLSLDHGYADGFWQAHLAEHVPKLMPQALEDQKTAPSSGEQRYDIVSQLSLKAVVNAAEECTASVLSLLQLTWTRLLAYYSCEDDVCFGNVYSGRNISVPDVENIVGPCFNTLPVRIKLRQDETNQQVVRRLHDHNLAVMPLQPSNLRQIQRRQGVGQFFDTLLLLQAETEKLDPSIWTLDEDTGAVGLPLILEIIPGTRADRLDFVLHSNQDSLSKHKLEAIAEDYDHFLKHTVQYLDAGVTNFPMLSSEKPLKLVPFHPTTNVKTMADSSEPLHHDRWTPHEEEILRILQKLSEREMYRLNSQTSIFQLGFDSISAAQIAAELRKKGHKLTGGDIMEASTISEIARLCCGNEPRHPESDGYFDFSSFSNKHLPAICSQLSIDRRAVAEIRPCTPFQSSVLAEFVRSGGENYLSCVRYELADDTDIKRLRQEWNTIFSRHEMLRTGFVEIDDVQSPFAMILYPPDSCQPPWIEDGLTMAQDVAIRGRTLLKSLHRPPWRIGIGTKGRRKIMQLTILHALFDANTLEIILHEVSTAYTRGQLPEVVPIKPCLSRIMQQTSSGPPDDISISCDADAMPITRFPNLHSHNLQGPGPLKTENECSRSLKLVLAGCREAAVTLQVAGQCAWARLLSFYTGESANTFGVVLTGRSTGDAEEGVVFPCITTVPTSITVESSNQVLLKKSAKHLARLMKNPFALSRSRLTLGARGRAFDSIFVLQKLPSLVLSAPWTVIDDLTSVDYALSMELIPTLDDKLRFQLTFLTQAIPLPQAELILKQFNMILLDTLDNLKGEASQPSYVEKALISTVAAGSPAIDTTVETLHQFVQMSAERLPNKVAFEFVSNIEDGRLTKSTWTYAEVEEISNRIAHMLQNHGAAVGDIVGTCFDKCPEAAFTILGVLKAGCAYIALDPDAPEARKNFILEDSGVRILCTVHDKADSLALKDSIAIFPVDRILMANQLPCPPVVLSRQLVADDICYCLYTSGTTGTPKGCLITHGNAVQFVLAFQRLFAGHWDSESRFLQFASFHFDVSVMEQFWSWSNGICVTSAPRDLLLEDLSAAIRALQITHIDLTPSLARLLRPEECPSLCRGAFITGGEQLRQEIIDTWAEKGVLYNGYGPSEVTIGCTMYPRIPSSAKPSNIGFPYENAGVHVLDPRTRCPVLRGAIGELCISGPLVGKGYLNRPGLTAARFEFVPGLGLRVYHTGDLARLLHDGSICFVGRADDQVKLRGQRLEIGEINHVIHQTSTAIKDVVTLIVRHHGGSSEQLVTFIASQGVGTGVSDGKSDVDEGRATLLSRIRRACTAALPAYMVPSHMVPVDIMPLTANNKIDEKSLRSFFQDLSAQKLHEISSTQAADHTIDSAALGKVVTAVSKVTRLSRDEIDSSSRLFELGIDSISVISLSRKLKVLGFSAADPSMIMKNPVVADLLEAMKEQAKNMDNGETAIRDVRSSIAAFEKRYRPAVQGILKLNGHAIEKIAPCTPLQEGMISRHLSTDDKAYSSSFTFMLNSDLNPARLQAAWEHVAEQNEILRTHFVPTSDGYAQVVVRDLAISSTRFQHLSKEDYQNFKDVATNHFAQWASDIQTLEGDLWRVLFCPVPGKSWMTLKIFHGLYDGNSLSLMLDEVAHAYQGISIAYSKPAYHDVLPLGPLRPETGAEDFWRKSLDQINLINLPRQHLDNGARVVEFNIKLQEDIRRIQSQVDVTDAAVSQTCWLMVLRKVFGIVPVVGMVVSGRTADIDGVENTIGPLFNTVPCQVEISAASTTADLMIACHRFNAEAMPYHHSALSKISKWLGRKADEPLFDSLFVFQKVTHDFPESRKLWQLVDSSSRPHYPLALEVEQTSSGTVRCTIVAQSEYVSHALVEELSSTLLEQFQSLSGEAHQPVDALSRRLLSPQAGAGNADKGMRQFSKEDSMVNGIGIHHEKFEWDNTTKLIRTEIASLGGSDTEDVMAYTSIFELGLDSIDAIKLSARLKAAKILITVSKIMQAGCIAQMAKHASAPDPIPDGSSHSTLDQVKEDLTRSLKSNGVTVEEYDKALPVTPLQEGMLANYGQYYSQDVLKISDEVDIEKLKCAWHTVVATHDVLRTRFVEVDDIKLDSTFAQVVGRDVKLEISSEVLDSEDGLQELLSRQQEEAVDKGISQPPLRLTLVTAGPDIFLVVGLPHAVYDGWSIDLLHQDVAKCYVGAPCERPSYEPILEQNLGPISEKSWAFWRNKLRYLQPRPFPLLQQGSEIADRCEIISKTPAYEAKAFCKAHSVTLQSLGLACWALVLAHYLRCRDVCFGLVLACRDTENANEMMFPTMNTVPIRATIAGTRLAVIDGLHKLCVSVSEHQHFPLRRGQSLVHGSPSRIFDTLFIYQKRPRGEEPFKSLYKSISGLSTPEYPVNVELEVLEEKLVWRSACNPNVFGEEGNATLLKNIDDVLGSILGESSEAAVTSLADGLSVCGLPPFENWVDLAPAAEVPSNAQEEEAHLLPLEKILVDVLAETAHISREQIKKSTSLYHLGLDSISAIKVSSALRRQSISLPVGEMLRALTVEKMAEAARPSTAHPRPLVTNREQSYTDLLDRQPIREALERAGVRYEEVESIFPCTAGQNFFLGFWQASGHTLFYPEFWFLTKGASVSEERINTAWQRLVQAVPMLRTSFLAISSDESLVVQVILKSSGNPVVWLSDQAADSLSVAGTRTPNVQPPVFLTATRSELGMLLKLHIHHALYDGVSLPAMIQTFQSLCNNPSRPLDRNCDFQGYIQHIQESTAKEEQKAFWTSYLEDHRRHEEPRPTSFGAQRVANFRAGMLKDTKPIQRWVENSGLSFQAFFLAAFALAHVRSIARCDLSELISGVYLANRSHDHQDLSRLLAPVVNVVPLRIPVGSQSSLLQSARAVQRDLGEIASIENSTVSLQEIYEWTGIQVQVFVNFLKLPESERASESVDHQTTLEESVPGEIVGDVAERQGEQGPSPFAGDVPMLRDQIYLPSIDIEAAVRDDALDVGVFAPTDLLDTARAGKLLDELCDLLLSCRDMIPLE